MLAASASPNHSPAGGCRLEQKLNVAGHPHLPPFCFSPGYPNDVPRIVSDEGYGRNEYIETQRPLVVITAPGPGSGKMAVCLSSCSTSTSAASRPVMQNFETFPHLESALEAPGKPGL